MTNHRICFFYVPYFVFILLFHFCLNYPFNSIWILKQNQFRLAGLEIGLFWQIFHQLLQLSVLSQRYTGWDFWWIGWWGRKPGHREPGAGWDRHRDLRKSKTLSVLATAPAPAFSRWLDSGCDYCRPFFRFMRCRIIVSDYSRCVFPWAKI